MINEIERELLDSVLIQPRLTRSKSLENKNFCKLDNQNRLEIVAAPNRADTSFLDNFEEANQNFEQISDDKERVEAYRDLARTLDKIIRDEKRDNLKNLNENSKFIKNQQKHIEKLETELQIQNESLLNTKELLNRVSNENIKLKQTNESLEKNSNKQNEKILNVQELYENLDVERLIRHIKEFISEDEQTDETQQELNKTINDIVEDLHTLTPTITQIQNLLQNSKMQVEAEDVIAGIPMFSGEIKNLDGFINSAELYYNLVEDDQKPTVLKIIKAKITGDALSKAGPFNEEMNTWALLKNI